jgi:protein-L-isoaspartate(D-aspartate) O-methyltransferase
MTDRDRAAQLRNAMVDVLLGSGSVQSAAVEAALQAVPRHLFAPWLSLEDAYSDRAWIIPESTPEAPATISQPTAVGMMLESFDLKPGQNVLEIGAGTGYNAALLAHIVGAAGRVVSIDIEAYLVEAAKMRLAGLANVQVIHGDGGAGFAPQAPYDRIVATVGAWDLPPEWRGQLAPDGRLVIPLHLFGEPQNHILVSFKHAGSVLLGRGLRSLDMVLMRGEYARNETPAPMHFGEEWRGRAIYPKDLNVTVHPPGTSLEPQSHELVIDKPQARLVVTLNPAT